MIRDSRFEIRDSELNSNFESRICNRTCFIRWLVLAAVFSVIPAFAAQQPIEEKVVVTANAYPVPFENLSRAVAVFTREDIDNLPAHSIADILAQAASVDIRSRAPFGIQNDLSVRGSSFSQVLVLVDGMRINDSQTGHHNADIPVPLQDIERVEVLLGPGSSVYGADAFGGTVNIITRHHPEQAQSSIAAGQDGFVEGSFSAGLEKGRVQQSVSVSANRSSGFQYDRDFRSITASARTNIGERTSFQISHANKEFGANGFYGPAPSKEWTNQTLVSFERRFEGSSGSGAVLQAYYRTHGDRFLYNIDLPGLFESSHRTHESVVSARVRHKVTDAGMLTLGGEAGGDWIVSNTLGRHAFARTSLFGEFQWMPGKTAVVYPGLRLDYYSNFGASVNPSLSGSWWIMPRLKLRASAGHAFRIPTFTELYYRDPNHEASSTLKPERAWSEEIGADFIPAKSWLGSLTLFSRQEQDVIDWIRASAGEKWHTANIRNLRTLGAEISLEHSLGSQARIAVHYTRISIDAGKIDFKSKYVLDYARDSWTASASFPMRFAFEYQQTASYKRRADGRSYCLLDGRLERHFRKFTAALDLTNMLNSEYQEVIGVDMPGRWFALSFRSR
jgi:outer membrane cobalamin receptor